MRTVSEDPFVKVCDENISALQTILKQRLPKSAHEYNMLLSKRHFRQKIQVYTLDGDLSESAIILLIIDRQDYGQDISISVSQHYIQNEYLRNALINTKMINWDCPYLFTSVDRLLSPMVMSISTSVKKNSIIVNPNYQYVFDVSEALHQDLGTLVDNGIDVRPLDIIDGTKFLIDNWKYTTEGTSDYVLEVLEKNPSSGVYVDGKLACGALVNAHGLIGLLYTDQHYRRMGLAQLCMRFLFKEMSKIGMVPCSTSQSKNEHSCSLHCKLGMTISNETDYIFYIPYASR